MAYQVSAFKKMCPDRELVQTHGAFKLLVESFAFLLERPPEKEVLVEYFHSI